VILAVFTHNHKVTSSQHVLRTQSAWTQLFSSMYCKFVFDVHVPSPKNARLYPHDMPYIFRNYNHRPTFSRL